MFRLVSPSGSGINFSNDLDPTNDLNILTYLYYYNGAGVAMADFNNDSLQDIYFTSNQGADKLYLNRGGLRFEDITDKAGINNSDGWTTGVTHVDINHDGLLDIYVCKVGTYQSIEGSNLLFINQGIGEDGIPVFKESAADYGLDVVAYSTQAAFFDYDLDGDLDMYLLCYSIHPNRSYGRGENRNVLDTLTGDKLFENVNGKYKDVSQKAGIFQGRTGYGLGLAIGDLNRDGYPDIYVGNDFFENDYYYQNNGDKTFSELISSDQNVMGHTTHYSMGNSIVDINNDGRSDIISLDMLPEDLVTLKVSGVEEAFPIYNRYISHGYAPQYMQNTLHINRGQDMFSETAFFSGIAATDWSWSVLAADYDMDGFKDLYITNGILGATNNMDYISFISQDYIQKEIASNKEGQALGFTKEIPQVRVDNYAFRNNGDITFTNVSNDWFESQPSFSNGGVYGDLDNDGDLDLVINNINQKAFVYENLINNKKDHNYVCIKLKGPENNTQGIGARVRVFADELRISEENFPTKSYLSAVSNDIIIGLGKHTSIDSVKVTWPDFLGETKFNIKANKTLNFNYVNAQKEAKKFDSKPGYLTNSKIQLEFKHHEEATLDFDRDALVPFAMSNEGPDIEVADVNGDSLDDIIISGAKLQPSALFMQNTKGEFVETQKEVFDSDSKSEDVGQLFFDADGDHDYDLLIVSGGNEFTSGDPLKPRLYINEAGQFTHIKNAFNNIAINASVVKAIDLENDGDYDIVIGSSLLPGKFGENAENFIFKNNGAGQFEDITQSFSQAFQQIGLVTDLDIADFDGNGYDDIVVVGEWMPATLFLNNGKSLSALEIPDTEGWWKSVAVADFDKDGDLDFVAGNWGDNTRLSASKKEPIKLYRTDFDNNGNVETLITYFYRGEETVLSSKDELARQMPFINKKFNSYHAFATADIKDIFSPEKMNSALKKEAKMLSTCYFENKGNNKFEIHVLPTDAQLSSVNDVMIDDFNSDGFNDLLLVGNNYEISTQLGRLDASHGVLLLNDQHGFFKEQLNQKFNISGAARDIEMISINRNIYYVVAINNGSPIFLKKRDK